MMVRSRGPVWHKKQKEKGIMPDRLRGVDKDATWCTSKTDGWIYGHGTFMITPHATPIVGMFKWMINSGNEAKQMEREVIRQSEYISTVCMDSKADDQELFYNLKNNHGVTLITVPRKGMNKSASRKKYIKQMRTPKNRNIYKKRSITVEPMQGLMKDIFDLETCWMRGELSNRWIFAAMGIAVQSAQWNAYKRKKSTWKIKTAVLGV